MCRISRRLAVAYALKGETERAIAELAEARRLAGEVFSSIAGVKAGASFGVPKVGALFEATYFAGLRQGRGAGRSDRTGRGRARYCVSFTSSIFTPRPACRLCRALSIRWRKRGSFSRR